jgi:hypothetical protein
MSKRTILQEDYSPVGARLQRYRQSATEGEGAEEEAVEARSTAEPPTGDGAANGEGSVADLRSASRPRPKKRRLPRAEESPPEEDVGAGPGMTDVLRCRVTQEERRRWHDLSYRVTGEHNQFSRIFRALLVLLENAEGELDKKLDELQRLRRPAKADRVGITMYEYHLAQILYDAMRAAGRPKA